MTLTDQPPTHDLDAPEQAPPVDQAVTTLVVRPWRDERLAQSTEPVEGPGWPPARAYPVRQVLGIVVNEEWEHRLFAERDLSVLEAALDD